MSENTTYRCDVGVCREPAIARITHQPLLNPLLDQNQQYPARRVLDVCHTHTKGLTIRAANGTWEWTNA